jgi:hypothetical protein
LRKARAARSSVYVIFALVVPVEMTTHNFLPLPVVGRIN